MSSAKLTRQKPTSKELQQLKLTDPKRICKYPTKFAGDTNYNPVNKTIKFKVK